MRSSSRSVRKVWTSSVRVGGAPGGNLRGRPAGGFIGKERETEEEQLRRRFPRLNWEEPTDEGVAGEQIPFPDQIPGLNRTQGFPFSQLPGKRHLLEPVWWYLRQLRWTTYDADQVPHFKGTTNVVVEGIDDEDQSSNFKV